MARKTRDPTRPVPRGLGVALVLPCPAPCRSALRCGLVLAGFGIGWFRSAVGFHASFDDPGCFTPNARSPSSAIFQISQEAQTLQALSRAALTPPIWREINYRNQERPAGSGR